MEPAVETVVIPRQFRGPPDSANGGYACGLLGVRVPHACRVRLHVPPPLEKPLAIRTAGAYHVSLNDGEVVAAEGVVAEPPGEPPPPVDFDAAMAASARYRWATGHPFPGCFVCGPERHDGDGLCIFPGAVDGRPVVAAPWVPHPSFCDAGGRVRPEIVWAALDCPSWFGLLDFEPGTRTGLLGQLTARIIQRPSAGEPCVVIGWSRGREGRKLYGGAALYTAAGTLLGSSEAVWIAPRDAV